jgi:gliding motility-associated-like protein
VIDTSSFHANAGPNQAICKGESTTLTASGGITYQWSTGASTATVNVTPSVTTIYTVTVSNSICTATANVTVTVNPIPIAAISGDTIICLGLPVILTASGGTSYVWSNSDTTAIITVSPLTPTTYNVTVTSAGCSSTSSISINLLTPPTANAGNDTTINIGESAQLHGSGGVDFSWSPEGTLSCSTCAGPIATPLSTTSYVLVVTGANGCKSSDTVTVKVEVNCGDVFVPNAFSPNNEGKNELECVYGNCIKSMEFSVYDRWGEKVFTSTDTKICWDGTYKGKKLNTGVFVYYLKATLYNRSEISKKGNINLFR